MDNNNNDNSTVSQEQIHETLDMLGVVKLRPEQLANLKGGVTKARHCAAFQTILNNDSDATIRQHKYYTSSIQICGDLVSDPYPPEQ